MCAIHSAIRGQLGPENIAYSSFAVLTRLTSVGIETQYPVSEIAATGSGSCGADEMCSY